MKSRQVRRRRLLQLGGATLATAAAGCLGGDSGNNKNNNTGSTPTYAQWVPAVDGEVMVSYINITEVRNLESDESNSSDETGSLEDIEDPMMAVPLSGMFVGLLSASIGLSGTRLGDLITLESDQASESDFNSVVNELLVANETTVMIGEIDTDEIDTTVTAATDSIYGETQFEQTGDVSGFAIYEPASSGSQETTLAVSGDAIIQAESQSDIERVIETKQGDGTRAVDEFETFQRLLSTGGNGHVAFGGYSPDGYDGSEDGSESGTGMQFEALEGANGFAGSLTISESDSSASMGIAFDELSETKRDALESSLGTLGSDVSVDFDGGFVSASATYADDALADI